MDLTKKSGCGHFGSAELMSLIVLTDAKCGMNNFTLINLIDRWVVGVISYELF